MSSSSINVQIGAIRSEMDPGPVELGLVVAAFLITYAGLLPIAGGLVDARDRRRIFLLGVGLFGLGCVLAAAAPGVWPLIAGRSLQGCGAALSAPAALALITAGIEDDRLRNRAVAIYSTMGAAGFSLGLVLPGFVVATFGWRMSFAVLVPIVALVLLVAWRLPSPGKGSGERVDVVAAAVLTVALMVAMHGLAGLATTSPGVLVVEAAAVLIASTWLWRHGGVSGFAAHLLRRRPMLAPCLSLAVIWAGVVAAEYTISLALAHRGFTAAEIGLTLVPQPIAFSLLAPVGARLASRWGARPVLAAGMSLVVAAFVVLTRVDLASSGSLGLAPAMALIGAGLALSYPSASIAGIAAAGTERRGAAASLLAFWQFVGGAAGIATLTAFSLVPDAHHNSIPSSAFVACVAVVAVGGLATWLIGAPGRGTNPAVEPTTPIDKEKP